MSMWRIDFPYLELFWWYVFLCFKCLLQHFKAKSFFKSFLDWSYLWQFKPPVYGTPYQKMAVLTTIYCMIFSKPRHKLVLKTEYNKFEVFYPTYCYFLKADKKLKQFCLQDKRQLISRVSNWFKQIVINWYF
jgi:hypothetical protein